MSRSGAPIRLYSYTSYTSGSDYLSFDPPQQSSPDMRGHMIHRILFLTGALVFFGTACSNSSDSGGAGGSGVGGSGTGGSGTGGQTVAGTGGSGSGGATVNGTGGKVGSGG